jgi:hypothetical protein
MFSGRLSHNNKLKEHPYDAQLQHWLLTARFILVVFGDKNFSAWSLSRKLPRFYPLRLSKFQQCCNMSDILHGTIRHGCSILFVVAVAWSVRSDLTWPDWPRNQTNVRNFSSQWCSNNNSMVGDDLYGAGRLQSRFRGHTLTCRSNSCIYYDCRQISLKLVTRNVCITVQRWLELVSSFRARLSM